MKIRLPKRDAGTFAVKTVAAVMSAVLTAVAHADDIWFYADFDSPPTLDGEALLETLPEDELTDGRFGRAGAFRTRFWKIADPEWVKTFPREHGSFSCFFRSEERALTNRTMDVFAYCGFWTYNWGWGDGSFRTSRDIPGQVRFRYMRGGSPVRRSTAWQHFAATWDAERLAVYLDGRKIAEKKNPPRDDIRGVRAEKFVVGSFGDGRKAADLVLDDITVFRRVLAEDEIRALATGEKRPRAASASLLLSQIDFKTFFRDDDSAALRCTAVSDSGGDFRLTGEVGGRPLAARTVRLDKGRTPLAVGFDAGSYRPGRYQFSFRLTDCAGRVSAEKRGELAVRARLAPESFRFLNWGGYDQLTTNFLTLAGFTSANVGVGHRSATVPGVRYLADAGICPNIRYENWRRDKGATTDEAALERRARADLASYEGLFAWRTTLVNSEVYGDPPKGDGIKSSPAEIDFAAIGVKPPSGVISSVPDAYGKLRRYFLQDMSPYRYNAAARRAVQALSPGNVVWSEPMFAGASAGLDMMADWFYAYSTVNTLAEMRTTYAAHRPFGKPFMPTLAMVYWHPLAKKGPARRLAQTCDEVIIKSWLAAGAVRMDALSAYEADAWQRGLTATNNLCERDAAVRYGEFFRTRFRPAAELLRGLEPAPARVAVLLPDEISWMAGFWWGRVHYRNALVRGLARDGIPFDVLYGDDMTAERLKRYRVLILPMGKVLLRERHAALLEAAKSGSVVVQDRYGVFDFPGGVKLPDLAYTAAYVQRPGGLARMYAPLGAYLAPRRKELIEAQTAFSSCDTHTNGFTLVKEAAGGVRHVVVVNDARRSGGCPQTSVFTNAWYRPMGAEQRITTWFDVPPGGEVREFNPPPGARRLTARAPRGGGRVALTADYAGAQARVFGIFPRPETKLSVAGCGEAVRGGRTTVRFEVSDAGGPVSDRRVLRVTVTDPEGHINDASGLYVTHGGVAQMVIRFAADDPLGSPGKRWSLKAEELSSGETCSAAWCLKR